MNNHRFVWHDFNTKDVEGATRFYGEMFNWKFDKSDQEYAHITAGDQMIGGIRKMNANEQQPPSWLAYVLVDDVAATVGAIEKQRGRTYVPTTVMDKVGTFAVTADPTGAVFAPWRSARAEENEPHAASPMPHAGTFCWDELVTTDPAAAGKFYASVFGWELQAVDMGGGNTYTLFNRPGTTKFMAAMKSYAKQWAFKHPTGRDMFASLEKDLGQNLDWYFSPVFEQVGGLRLKVRSAHCIPAHGARGVSGDGSTHKTLTDVDEPDTGAWQCDVIVQNTGVIHVPIEIELDFTDGSAQRVVWDDHGGAAWKRFDVEHSSKLAVVKLDPDNKIALDVPIQHQYRLDGDGGASLRAGARIASWAQSLMQLVGP
jgi:predicted enzyme related to lactoylglutathione lyase